MSKRRGGAPAAATGFLWRQQQERALLAAALRQLPSAGAPPQRLLRELQRVLLCVEHTLLGPPSDCAAATAADSSFPEGRGDGGGAAGVGMAAQMERSEPERCDADTKLEELAAQRAVAELRELLVAEEVAAAETVAATTRPDAAQGGIGGCNSARSGEGWDGAAFTTALLHNLLALSSDLFDGIGTNTDGATRNDGVALAVGAGAPDASADGAAAVRRDDLAAAARPRLPVAVYGRIVATMGWEELLVDLLAWVADPRVATEAARRALLAVPDLGPGLATALASALPAEAWNLPDACAVAAAGAAGTAGPAAGAELQCRTEHSGQAWWRPAGALLLAKSPTVLARLADAVRQDAATAAGGECGTGSGEGGGSDTGARCLLLLAHALAGALRESSELVAGSAATTAAGPAQVVVVDSDADGCAAACCEALQEGLCAWQSSIVADATSANMGPRLLALLRDQLLPLLDEQGRKHIAAQSQQQQGRAAMSRRPLLPYASVIRLRSRIALLGMAANTPPTEQAATAALADRRKHATVLARSHATEDDVWQDLPSKAPALVNTSALASGANVFGGSASTAASRHRDSGWREGKAAAAVQAEAVAASAAQAEQGDERLLPAWLRAATTAGASASPHAKGLLLLLGLRTSPIAMPTRPTLPADVRSASDSSTFASARVAAVAVALLTPGMASWLGAQADPRVAAAAGPDPYSPFRMALALLELLQGVLAEEASLHALPYAGSKDYSSVQHHADGGEAGERHLKAGDQREAGRPLRLLVLRMAAECIACVADAEQQLALQAALLTGPRFRSLQAHLAADSALQAAAGRALVALSNRSAALEGSLERLALSAAAEAQRLAATARQLLPFASLSPSACVRRLLLDGLTHPGQQPWVLQLLRCFAAAAAAPVAPPLPPPAAAAAALRAAAPIPTLLSCLQDVLRDAGRMLRTGADRRSLLGLVEGLVRCGVAAPAQLLAQVALPALQEAQGMEGGRLAVPQAHAALLVAQLILGGAEAHSSASTAAPDAAGLPHLQCDPAAVLAASRPAALLLAVAATLEQLYDQYDSRGGLEAATIDVAVGVLERGVQLYGAHLAGVGGGAVGAGSMRPHTFGAVERAELAQLAAGCETLPRRLVAALLPLQEAAASANAAAASDEDVEEMEHGGGAPARELVNRLAPAAHWRPRALRGADPRVAHSLVYDVLAFAASSVANAAAMRAALLEAAADAADDGADDAGVAANQEPGVPPASAGLWGAWGCGVLPNVASEPMTPHGAGVGLVARHVAATAARGMPQLPAARLAEALVSALAALLPTCSQEQARRVLLAVLPALVRAVGGAAALAPAMQSTAGSGSVAAHKAAQCQGVDALDEVLGQELSGSESNGAAEAADIAVAVALACRGAAAALRALGEPFLQPPTTPAPGDGAKRCAADKADFHTSHCAAGSGLATRSAASVSALADRCAAHMSLLATQLAAVQQKRQYGMAPAGGSAAGPERQLAAVASVLLAELCRVAASAAEAAKAATGSSERGLDVWQAVILSVLQQLVTALVASASAAVAPGAAASGLGEGGAASDAVAAATEWLYVALRRVARSLRLLPGTAAEVLWGAVERLCEEQGDGQGAAAHMAEGEGVSGARGMLMAAVSTVGAELLR